MARREVYYGELEELLKDRIIAGVEDYLPHNFILHLGDGTKIGISGIEEYGVPVLEAWFEDGENK